MNLLPDLFGFAYIPCWYIQLDDLAEMARPEPWRFRNPMYSTKNHDTPILERYIQAIFKKQAIDFNTEPDPEQAATYFHVENEHACLRGYKSFDGTPHPGDLRHRVEIGYTENVINENGYPAPEDVVLCKVWASAVDAGKSTLLRSTMPGIGTITSTVTPRR